MRQLLALSLISTLAFLSESARSVPLYRATVLQAAGNSTNQVTAINDHGTVTGFAYTFTPQLSSPDAVYWDSQGVHSLVGGDTQTHSAGLDLNNAGQVAGSRDNQAKLWTNGVEQHLAPLAGYEMSRAEGINDAGQVVGRSRTWASGVATLWEQGVASALDPLAGLTNSSAHDIDSSGRAVGYSWLDSNLTAHATLWDSGQAIDLGVLSGFSWSNANAMNDRGQIVGSSGDATGAGAVSATLWQNGEIIGLNTLAGALKTYAHDINDAGYIVGDSSFGNGGGSVATLWHGDDVYDLNALIVGDDGFALDLAIRGAAGINARGDIAAFGNSIQYLLTYIGEGELPPQHPPTEPPTTVPEPGTMALCMAGLAAIFVSRRRRADRP